MKKILSLLLIFILLFLCVGCDQSENPNNSSTSESEIQSQNESESIVINKFNMIEISDSAYGDPIFNDFPLTFVTDIVKATYKGTEEKWVEYIYDGKTYYLLNYVHSFEITEVVKGERENGILKVFSLPINSGNGYSTYDIEYKVGEDYLLLLEEIKNVWDTASRFEFLTDGLIIPLDSLGKPDIAKATLEARSFIACIDSEDMKASAESGDFIQYVLEKTKDNPHSRKEWDFIDDDSFENVISKSEYVIVALVEEMDPSRPKEYFKKYYSCKIIRTVKGNIEEDTLTIEFPTAKVQAGKLYTIALDQYENNKEYRLSSQNSIWEYP